LGEGLFGIVRNPRTDGIRVTAAAALDAPDWERDWLVRPDLAELGLEGRVRAPAFRAVVPMHGRLPVADISLSADPSSERIDQLIFGEVFDVLDRDGDRLWGRARRDGVVGWIDRAALDSGAPLATHRVASATAVLPLNALIHHAWSGVAAADLMPTGEFERDPVAVAERMLGAPHQLGARTSRATDCSGLIQQCLYACGLAGPRRSDEQARLGAAVERDVLKRGDLVVWLHADTGQSWTGHSAFALDDDRVIHATGHAGAVVIEDLAEAGARYAADGFAAPVFRRLQA
jgi:cell wall-associated NlpC family hydrolase